MMKEPVAFLSLSAVARRLDVSAPRAARLRASGAWLPDGLCGRDYIFREDRLAQLASAAQAARLRPQPGAVA